MALENYFQAHLPEVSPEKRALWGRFHALVSAESERQNLTKLLGEEEFFFGHVLDCWHGLKSGLVSYPAMDLGSGVGVPGLGMAIFTAAPWILAESENHKAEFLKGAASTLGLSDVSVHAGRAEGFLKKGSVQSVVARAVGPAERILGWIGECSTWNNLVLFKGPGWDEEYSVLQKTRWRNKVKLTGRYEYSIPWTEGETRTRVIIQLTRQR